MFHDNRLSELRDGGAGGGAGRQRSLQACWSAPAPQLECPVCGGHWPSLTALQAHVETCLDMEMVEEAGTRGEADIICDVKKVAGDSVHSEDRDMFEDSEEEEGAGGVREAVFKHKTVELHSGEKSKPSCFNLKFKENSSDESSFFKRKFAEMQKQKNADIKKSKQACTSVSISTSNSTTKVNDPSNTEAVQLNAGQRNEMCSSTEIPKPADGTRLSLACPVCLSETFHSQTALSLHIDECLSKKEIASILKSESLVPLAQNNRKSTKRKPDQQAKNSKMKRLKKGNATIDSFFQRKIS